MAIGGRRALSIHVPRMYETRLRSGSADAWSSRAVNTGMICSAGKNGSATSVVLYLWVLFCDAKLPGCSERRSFGWLFPEIQQMPPQRDPEASTHK